MEDLSLYPFYYGKRHKKRATDGTRTRDFLLGKEVLYQLSHCRTAVIS